MNVSLGVIDMHLHTAFCLKTCIFEPKYTWCTLKKVPLAQKVSYIILFKDVFNYS